MNESLPVLLRIAGAGLILLAILHVPIGKYLGWKTDVQRLSPVNRSVFHVHTLFICLGLVLLGLPCLLDPWIFLVPSRTGAWFAWSIAAFWTARLLAQIFIYPSQLWRGKRIETAFHYLFTLLWILLAGLFGTCGAVQMGWIILH